MPQTQPPLQSTRTPNLPGRALLVVQALVGLGAAAWMARAVDTGLTSTWTGWQQGGWFLGMLLALSLGGRALIALWHGDTRFAWLPFIALASAAAALGLGLLLRSAFGLRFWSGFFAGLAAIQAWCTWRLPWWFWEGWRARWLRGLIGDRATRVVCGIAAAFLAVAAIAVMKP